ncbi:proline iminopeptidase-family hydrolase [Mucilaginibacter jinjuensis]|uniref:Proline iminopeptidase-family hydrolase n=1 Tax=Mucilaginibacter jinjuensis TaxID=1176721 RepID=A0ABY7T7F7_9SPHI|nr:proline iminopeptidase-family hydrolase [Mucilaginibacter jinjuensis]WCT11781.1 proline iminopeptidase-family hydrolase [Mucilaginibacter jinjuensis]
MKLRLFLLALFAILFFDSRGQLKPHEGYVQVKGGRIWYKIVGTGKGTPLLILHGGPGSRSCGDIAGYSALGNDRPVILYDQLGSGFSDRPTDTTLWVLPRFVDEVTALRKALNLKEINILGSSWGAAVVIEYMITRKPTGVKSVIFAGPLLGTARWIKDAQILLGQMPKKLQDTIHKYEDLKQYNAPAYVAATDSFYARYLEHKQYPAPKSPLCEGAKGFNTEVYNYMWGPTEFNCIGTLQTWTRIPDLHRITQPVLFIAGQYDEARPATMYEFQKMIKGSKVAIVPNAGHHKLQDNPEAYIGEIRKFLKGK